MFSGAPVRGDEPGIGQPMPGATPEELQASLVWNMRAALNVAALQCQFEPTLLSVPNYNAILYNHKDELKKSFDILTKYFTRTAKSVKAGQIALDQFGTRTYSSFTTVHAQFGFCQTAGMIARDAVFTPRGFFYELAGDRMRELRNSLVPWGEQRFPRGYRARRPAAAAATSTLSAGARRAIGSRRSAAPISWPFADEALRTRSLVRSGAAD